MVSGNILLAPKRESLVCRHSPLTEGDFWELKQKSELHVGLLWLLMVDQVFLSPGLFSGELPECTQELMIDVTKSYYQKFLPLTQV